MHITHLSRYRYLLTVAWAVFASCVIVAIAAGLARATLNLSAALVSKPDIAVLLLLPDEGITASQLIKESKDHKENDYLVETKEGPKLVKLKRGEKEWYVALVEKLHQ